MRERITKQELEYFTITMYNDGIYDFLDKHTVITPTTVAKEYNLKKSTARAVINFLSRLSNEADRKKPLIEKRNGYYYPTVSRQEYEDYLHKKEVQRMYNIARMKKDNEEKGVYYK